MPVTPQVQDQGTEETAEMSETQTGNPTGPQEPEAWTPEEMRYWIDNQTYSGLLRWWRFAPTGDPFFQGETGEHYSKTMTAGSS